MVLGRPVAGPVYGGSGVNSLADEEGWRDVWQLYPPTSRFDGVAGGPPGQDFSRARRAEQSVDVVAPAGWVVGECAGGDGDEPTRTAQGQYRMKAKRWTGRVGFIELLGGRVMLQIDLGNGRAPCYILPALKALSRNNTSAIACAATAPHSDPVLRKIKTYT